jgi:hypothetical protein
VNPGFKHIINKDVFGCAVMKVAFPDDPLRPGFPAEKTSEMADELIIAIE